MPAAARLPIVLRGDTCRMKVEVGSTDTLEADDAGDADGAVRNWRYEQFVRLGFERSAAMFLAWSDHVDLGRARELARSGCRLDTLIRIVV